MNLKHLLATTAMMCATGFTVACDTGMDEPTDANEAQLDAELLAAGQDEDEQQSAEALDLAIDGLEPVELGEATVVGVETLDVMIPASLHGQGIAVPAKLVRPKWSAAVGKKPAMMVLHGSGGLLKMPASQADAPCSSQMETQFVDWSNRLAKLGYTVLLPSSYSARGFCDKHEDTARIPKTFDTDTEQVLSRVYDVDAASRYLCARSEVDCDRMGLLGFSQGATMVMIALHWQLDHAISYFRANKAADVGFSIPDLKPGRPEFQMGVAYYPGCGFDGVIPLSTSTGAAIENKFSPTGPLTVLHGSSDSLVTQCSTSYGTGARQVHSKQVATNLSITNIYSVTVYSGAHHSFDSASSTGSDATARDAALKVTLSKLATQL